MPHAQENSMTGHSHRFGWRTLRWVLAAATVPALLWACNSHPLEQPKPSPEAQTDLLYEVNPVRKLDLIFMVDNSISMQEEQDKLKANFPSFMERLAAIPGGLPDTRIAILSSNFGAGVNHPSDECKNYGDRASYLVKDGCNLDTAGGVRWLRVGGGMAPNFPGGDAALPTVFSCMANLGTGGCGYEHQLQSIRASFSTQGAGAVAPQNAGFLRDDAFLGIVILTDEDDCSGDPSAEFYAEPTPMGHAGSLRCATRGHVCNDMPVPAMNGFSAPMSSCKPVVHADTLEDKKSKLINIATFVEDIKRLKNYRTDKILVSGVYGVPDPMAQYALEMVTKPQGMELDLKPACVAANNAGTAAPGIRLKAFIELFENNSSHSICDADLKDAMTAIGNKLANIITNTCITAPLIDVDANTPEVQADCQVTDRLPRNDGSGLYTETTVPLCGPGGPVGNNPCWKLMPDATCGSRYRTVVLPEGRVPTPGTLQSIKCLTCTPDSGDPRCQRTP
jgi:hypothetical protein